MEYPISRDKSLSTRDLADMIMISQSLTYKKWVSQSMTHKTWMSQSMTYKTDVPTSNL